MGRQESPQLTERKTQLMLMLKNQAKLPNIYIICKSEWNSSNLPRWCSITQIWLGVL